MELATAHSDDGEELSYRLLGNAHEDVLTAFEATLKAVYLHGVQRRGVELKDIKPLKNDFQNIEFGQKRFAEFGPRSAP